MIYRIQMFSVKLESYRYRIRTQGGSQEENVARAYYSYYFSPFFSLYKTFAKMELLLEYQKKLSRTHLLRFAQGEHIIITKHKSHKANVIV